MADSMKHGHRGIFGRVIHINTAEAGAAEESGPISQALVRLLRTEKTGKARQDTELARTRTDARGRFHFDMPKPQPRPEPRPQPRPRPFGW